MVSPVNALDLAIECRFDAQSRFARARYLDWDAVHIARSIGAVNEKNVNVSSIIAAQNSVHVALHADRVELDRAMAQPSGLALGAYELSLEVEDQVVPLIHAPRNQDGVAAAAEL